MILYYFIHTTQVGFYTLCLLLSRGFYFYFVLFFSLLERILSWNFITRCKNYFKDKQEDPTSFLSLFLSVLMLVYIYTIFYIDKNDQHYVLENSVSNQKSEIISKNNDITNDKVEINQYRKYGKYNSNQISFDELSKINSDVFSWILVNGTSVNYPVVQTNNNDYYLNHDISGNLKGSGWIFMDYRNSKNMTDSNTIIYGHNLLNQTAFGSLSKIFTKEWFMDNNHRIEITTENRKYIYEIFSCYYIDPEIYYLQTNFYDDSQYIDFLNVLKSRSIVDFGIDVEPNDKIITLSTCTDDNRGRKVIHAKLISN